MAVPDEPLIARYEAGVELVTDDVRTTPINTFADSFTECLQLMIGSGENRVRAVLLSEYPRMTDGHPCYQYLTAAQGGVLQEALNNREPYFRYWHGNIVIIRAIFAYLGMDALRVFGAGLVVISFVALAYAIARATSFFLASAFVIPPVLMSDAVWLAFSAPHAISTAAVLSFSAAVVQVWSNPSPRVDVWRWPAVAVSAATAAFVDLLNIVPIAFMVSVFCVGIGILGRRSAAMNTSQIWLTTLIAAPIWAAAFLITNLIKWLIAVPFLGWSPVFSSILKQGAGWSATTAGFDNFLDLGRVSVAAETLAWWDEVPLGGWRPGLMVLGLACVVLLVRMVTRPASARALIARASAIAWPCLLFIIWIWVFALHAWVHGLFTYRGWAYALGILAAAACIPLAVSPRPSAENSGDTPRSPLVKHPDLP
jgi:hypothetical protein